MGPKGVRIVTSRKSAGHCSEFFVYKLVKKHGMLTCKALWLKVFVRGTVEWLRKE